MWFFYLLLAIGSCQAGKSNIRIKGSGTIVNGTTSLNINVQIVGNGGFGIGPQPGAGAGAGGTQPTQAPTTGQPTTATTPGGATPGTTPAPGAFTEEERNGLDKHNEFRQIHAVPLMTLNRAMCDEANAYAAKIAELGALQHSTRAERNGDGENLSMGCSTNAAQSMEEAVTNWYNEVCDPGYDFTVESNAGGTGHFTQVVWKASTVLGIGRAEANMRGMKCAYIVGRYRPAGNMLGTFMDNVKKGTYDSSYCASLEKKRRYFDVHDRAVTIGSPFTEVDVPDASSKDPKRPSYRVELLKKRKNFVHPKH